MHLMLTELCSCYSLCSDFIVFDHIVVPTEFLLSHLEIRLSEYVEWGWVFVWKIGWCDEAWGCLKSPWGNICNLFLPLSHVQQKFFVCCICHFSGSINNYCQKCANNWHERLLSLWKGHIVHVILLPLPVHKCAVQLYLSVPTLHCFDFMSTLMLECPHAHCPVAWPPCWTGAVEMLNTLIRMGQSTRKTQNHFKLHFLQIVTHRFAHSFLDNQLELVYCEMSPPLLWWTLLFRDWYQGNLMFLCICSALSPCLCWWLSPLSP